MSDISNDNQSEIPENFPELPEGVELTPEMIEYAKGIKPGVFVTMQIGMDAEGNISAGIVKVPIDLRIVEDFQAQVGDQLAEANIKLVIVKGEAFCAPIQASSIIIPGLIK